MRLRTLVFLIATLSFGLPASANSEQSCATCFEKRLVYFTANFDYEEYFETLKRLIPRAKAAGFNGIALASGGSGSLTEVAKQNKPLAEARYREIAALAKNNGLEIIPVGAGPDVATSVNPNLIEAFPVNNQPFTVTTDGKARSNSKELLSNSSFEIEAPWSPPQPADWYTLDGGAAWDATVGHSGRHSIRIGKSTAAPDQPQSARLYRELTGLRPFTAYQLSFWAKTDQYDGPIRIQIYDSQGNQPVFLNANSGLGWGIDANGNRNPAPNELLANQEWKQYNINFNSLGNTKVLFYMGTWSNGTLPGHVWLDDFSLKEQGLVQTVRRDSLPIQVQSTDGKTTYTEGPDYVIGAGFLSIPAKSKIQLGQRIRVSWYQSTNGVESNWGAPASSCSEEYINAQKLVATKTIDIFSPNSFFAYIDEWRTANWDPKCGGISAGEYIGATFAKTTKALKQISPNLSFMTWNDMFDPHHNALPKYWMVNGDLAEGWRHLPLDTYVVNWNMHPDASGPAKAVESLKFFASKGFKQMVALYYDDQSLSNVDRWLNSINLAEASGATNINGLMYTTWIGNGGYVDLERVADKIRQWAGDRWPAKYTNEPASVRD